MTHILTVKSDHCLFTSGEFLADSLDRLSCGTASYLVVTTEAHSATIARKIQFPAILAAPFPRVPLRSARARARLCTDGHGCSSKMT